MYEPVAIVGTACRLPGAATTPSKLWDLLKAPKDVLKEFPPERLGTKGFYSENPDMRGRTHVQHKSYLLDQDVRHFDNAFFHTNPKDAADMDPQQRILLETVYEAFEAAGWSLDDVDGSKTSVHVGVMTDDYLFIQGRDPDNIGGHAATGISRSILANRLSYAFNLRGASLALDTACSSSLVALHLAIQGLHRGEATQAVVAGTNLLMDSAWYIIGSSMHMISPESRSRMWDKDANGYARGEGCAAVVLKTLSQAIRDNDHIECIIRGSGVNSDGLADGSGITIPSPAAQTELIHQTYRDAGLDPVKDRCQYFECHGTGTQAGDPKEAQAIKDAFFYDDSIEYKDPLYCGSIKTVIGHLEGCAGLAGLIKASLAIQNKAIPPNLLFNELNPKIEPYYKGLHVPTSLLPWPETGNGPRRASVNSFGFGGTNAHAILESYEPSSTQSSESSAPKSLVNGEKVDLDPVSQKLLGPFTFSARTRGSLVDWLRELLYHLREDDSIDLDALSHTLNSKRSVLRTRAAIPAVSDFEDLKEKLEDQVNILSTSSDAAGRSSLATAGSKGTSLLGVFTGQGAQAAQMGYALLKHCISFKESIAECEAALASLPSAPAWSLSEALSADATESRVSEAQFSQPLCTAIQIALVDLLRSCNVHFSTVVGHSSGEIGAAYAAGLLNKRDAMAISYYRGSVTHLARGKTGQPGAMMAASMAFDAAVNLCSESQFKGRVTVAASNSPSSVTLSGDKDAVLELKKHLDVKQIQARLLQVDTAYHSHHMRACAEPYLRYLKELGVTVQKPPTDRKCHWFSSVHVDTDILENVDGFGLDGQYWVDNLTQSVLFSEAVKAALQANETGFTAALEVGPHAALKGPFNQTLKQSTSTSQSMAYTSCLTRGKNAIETFLEALTTLWSLVPSSVQLSGWRHALGLSVSQPPLKNLPPYAWDHSQVHWRESRVARNYRLSTQPPHDLLGRMWNDTGYEQTWRNTFRLSEMPWLKGHVFQGQILFPATGYLSLAVDAAKAFVKDQPVKFIEIQDLQIPTALPVGEGDEVEILFTIRRRGVLENAAAKVETESVVETEFVCYSYPNNSLEADKTCQGYLTIHLGESLPTDLAPTDISKVELTPSNVDRFYHAASEIGFAYTGPFRALHTLNKCWGHAKGLATWSKEDPDMNVSSTLHPAIVDIAFQTGLSTILSTAENSMHSPYLPIGVKRAIIDPNQSFISDVAIEAYMTKPTVGLGQRIETDINIKISGNDTGACDIQLEGVTFKAISEQQPSEDRNMMAKNVWAPHAAYGLMASPPNTETIKTEPSSYSSDDYERVALYYLRHLSQSLSPQEKEALQPHHQKLIRSIDMLATRTQENDNRTLLQQEWFNDDSTVIQEILHRDPTDINMQMLTSSAKETASLLSWRPAQTNTGVDERENLLSQLYQQTTWTSACNQAIARLLVQVSHTFPRTNILHLCGDAAEVVTDILDAVGDAYGSYTCASTSEETLDKLRTSIGLTFAKEKRILFEVFDAAPRATKDLYDVIVVTDICRERPDVSESTRQIRGLLRPGGFYISTELTGSSIRPLAVLGGSAAWWNAGGPTDSMSAIKTGEWDNILSTNGFSGIDSIFHDQSDLNRHAYSVFSTQAVDERFDVLRSPLTSLSTIKPTPVVFIGGETGPVSKLIRQAKSLLRGWVPEIKVWSRFDHIESSQIPPGSSVVSFQDLDRPLFSSPPSVNELKNLKEILGTAQNVLWVTSNRLVNDPYANIFVGIGRALRHEHIHLNLQFLDFDAGETWDVQNIISQFLRLVFSTSSPNATDGLLWVQEPELVVRDTQLITPRVVLDPESNEVYNAGRRRVVKPVSPATQIEVVHETSGSLSEMTLACSRSLTSADHHWQVQVKLSVSLHLNEESPCYLSYGTVQTAAAEQTAVLVVSETDSSTVTIHKDLVSVSKFPQECSEATLVQLAVLLTASGVVSAMASSGTNLVCDASDAIAKAISALASESAHKVKFVTVTELSGETGTADWVYVHPQSPVRAIKKVIPSDASALLCLASRDSTAVLLPCLPARCTVRNFDPTAISQDNIEAVIKSFEKHRDALSSVPSPTILSLSALSNYQANNSERFSTVINWSRDGQVDAIIRPLDPQALLSPNKTYFLVGMAGELGQSLAYFMVRAGARYIVLSSRNPKDNQFWLQDLRSIGIDIRIVKMDVTDRAQVHDTVRQLRQSMPEIGGVTNAALVLEPAVFANLSAASIAKQMMPKIHGTVHLDEVFKNDPLDFFMCFGSLGTVFGNPGHAIYHAGNAFMLSLVANRKRRGLAGSILNFGMLVDVGYVARADRSTGSNVEEWLRTDGLIALSEADFHHVILQGITVGHPDSPESEVIMGVDTYYDRGQTPKPRWIGTPRLSHMVRRVNEAVESEVQVSGSHQSKLESATTVEEAIPPVTELLSQKIKAMIQVSLDSIHPDEPLSRLGIDSINAIEIRKWLWEALKVEISMVKILGRDASASIIRSIATQYLANRPESTTSTSKVQSTNEKEVPATKDAQENVAPKVIGHEQDQSTLLGDGHSSSDSKAATSSESVSESSAISTYTPESELEFTRTERFSIAQAGLFYIYKFADNHRALNLTTKWKINGPLDRERLGRAFEKTVARHDALRTCFFASPGSSEVQQHLVNNKVFQLTQVQSDPEAAGFDVHNAYEQMKEHRYSLETADTLRATVVSQDAQNHVLIVGFHNLVVDVVSIGLILADVAREYQSQPGSPIPEAASFLDYTRQEIDDAASGRFNHSLNYWKKHLTPLPEPLPLLPVAKVQTRPTQRGYAHHDSERELSAEFVAKVEKISQDLGVTPMQFYLAAMQVFLCRLLDIDELVIGVLHTGRDPISKFRETIGHMASILPIRFKTTPDQKFTEVVRDSNSILLDSLEYANLPFAHIVDKIKPGVSDGNMPLIQVAYSYTVDETLPSNLGDCSFELDEADYTTVYDFVIDVRRSASGGHVLGITCTDDFYSPSATDFILDTMNNVIDSFVQQPNASVKTCKLFSQAQLDQAKSVSRTPPIRHSWPDTLAERFYQVAAQHPDSIAIKDGRNAITYSQLKQKFESFAGILLDAGATKGTPIAVYCKPSIDLYATMLAIFRIGAIFVPLDVSIPAARRNVMIEACKAHALVYHATTATGVAENHMGFGNKLKLLNLTELVKDQQRQPNLPELVRSGAGSISHILFTSGSTGVPKGIKLHQRGIMNYAQVSSKRYGYGQIKVLQQTSVGFDVAFSQIFSAFTNGGTLVVAPFEARGDPDLLSRLILEEGVEFTMCTPSEYNLLLTYAPERMRQCTNWRFAGAGGEVLPDRVIAGLRDLKLPKLLLTNWYGPTEVTVITSQDIPVADGATTADDGTQEQLGSVIGQVVPNNTIYITDEEDGSLLPVGMPGEISVGGTMVALGYLDSSLDDGVFVKNPFATAKDIEQGFNTMYKTGDRGFAQEDGSIVFLGRTKRGSTTIKLRGLRIDLNEVTRAVLGAAPDDLADAVVTVRGEPQFLVCHVVFRPGKHLEHQQLVDLVQALPLPRYMIPATIVALDRLPLVPNGKLDLELLRNLPLPDHTASKEEVNEDSSEQGSEPTETERRLRTLWAEVIGTVASTSSIGLNSSFHRVGGNSFLLVHLQYAIEREMGAKVPLSQLWQAADLRSMASLIQRLNGH